MHTGGIHPATPKGHGSTTSAGAFWWVGPDEAAVYSNFAVASVGIEQRTVRSLLDDVTATVTVLTECH